MSLTNAPIIGTDNVSPLYNPQGRWQIWNMNEIYLGTNGSGKYVPNVGDEVHEISGSMITRYVVHAIDPITFLPDLHQENNSLQTNQFSEDDLLFGIGPGTQSDTYRVYLDTSVTPYRLSVDKRLRVAGSSCQTCKIFKGANTSNSGIVISGTYDQNGLLLSENIPLELAASVLLNNTSIKVVADAYTQFSLEDGELVTAVFYSATGNVVSKRQLIIENTNFVRSTDAQKKYVSHISLETPFLSSSNSNLIEYPINVPLNTLNLMGVVHYSDGSMYRRAVDGTVFSVFGLDEYSATIVGQNNELVLKYTLQNNEEALNVHIGSETFVSVIYNIVTTTSSGNYAVKLFPYPVWSNINAAYSLRWFMYDLDRSISYDVTSNVIINTNYSTFNPTGYGVKQTLSVSLNLRAVNGNYTNFNHVQLVDVTLIKNAAGRPNIDNLPNWIIANNSAQSKVYGNNVYATFRQDTVSTWILRLAPNFNSKTDWIDGLYKDTNPMFDSMLESNEPEPTHFVIQLNATTVEKPISAWSDEFIVNQPLTNNDTLFIKFIKRTPSTDLKLSVAGLQLMQVDSFGVFV